MPCTPGLTPGKFCIGIENNTNITKVYYGQYKSGLYNEPYNSKLNLTYKQTQDSVLQNIHCHGVMLSFAKQCPPLLFLDQTDEA